MVILFMTMNGQKDEIDWNLNFLFEIVSRDFIQSLINKFNYANNPDCYLKITILFFIFKKKTKPSVNGFKAPNIEFIVPKKVNNDFTVA